MHRRFSSARTGSMSLCFRPLLLALSFALTVVAGCDASTTDAGLETDAGPEAADGFRSLYIGHSFFRPFALAMESHAERVGLVDHSQAVLFNGGENGAPQALWENAAKRAEIQAILDGGDIELFVMTYHPTYPTSEGYENWIDYALAQNPDTRIALALPWTPYPEATPDAAMYASDWNTAHTTTWHAFIDSLRALYPGTEIFCIPYGQSAIDLRSLFAAGQLSDVSGLTGAANDAIFKDALGHPGDVLIALGELVWLNAIYDVDLLTYVYDPGYVTDLKMVAHDIMNAHDPAYDASYR